MTVHHRDKRSLGQLFSDLSSELSTLVGQEVQLARTELGEKVAQLKTGAAVMTGGVFLIYAGLLAIVGAAVLALVALGWPPWAAALVGGLAIGAAGYALVRMGISALSPAELVPHETIETLKEDVPWLKSETK